MPGEPKDSYSDQELMEGLLNGDPQVLKYIKNTISPYLKCLVKEGKGNSHDADVLFHDATVVLFKKMSKGPLELTCRFTTYFSAVCKVIWRFRHNTNHINVCDLPELVEEAGELEELYAESLEYRLYRKHFGKLKEKQKELFIATLSGKPYNELYGEFGYKSADVFKSELCRIRKKLIRNIKSDPEYNRFNGKKHWSP